MAIQSLNPANGILLRTFTPLNEEAIAEKLTLAAEASRTYPAVPLEHRALCMRKLASLLENETDDLARIITLEMGQAFHASQLEVLKCATACR